jgi:gliding motility-associated-like protein
LLTLVNSDTLPDTLNYVVITDINGCTDADTVKVVVFPSPTAVNLTGSQNVCPGVTDIFYWFNTYNPNSAYQWLIEGGVITSINEDSIVVNWGTAQINAFIALVETTEYQCKNDRDTLKILVRINPKLKPVLPTPDDDLCSNKAFNIDYSTLLTNGSSYDWGISGGIINSVNNNVVNVTWNTIGEGSVWVIESVTADTVCAGISDTLTIMILPSALAEAGTDANICSGESVNLGVTENAAFTYEWLVTEGISNTTSATPTLTLENSGMIPDTLFYILKANLGNCPDFDTVQVVVYPSLKDVNAGNDITICSGIEQEIGTTAVSGQTYNWSSLLGLSDSTIANPVFIQTNISQTNVSLQYVLFVNNDFGCSDFDTININLKSAPIANAGNDVNICSGASSQLGTSDNSSYTYSWQTTNGLDNPTISSPIISLVNNNFISDTVKYYVITNLDGCIDTDSVQVVIYPSLKDVDAGLDAALCAGETYQLGTSNSISSQVYTWTPSLNLSGNNISNPVLDSLNTSDSNINLQYTLLVDNGFGCTASDTINITLKPQLRALTLDGNTDLCQFTNDENYTVSGFDNSTFEWTLNGGNLGIQSNNITLNWDTPGTYTLIVKETNQECEGIPYPFTITIHPKPEIPSIVGESTICPQKSIGFVYYTNGSNTSTYQWTINGGNITSTSAIGDTAFVNWTTGTIRNISVAEVSDKNCKSNDNTFPVIFDGTDVNMQVVTTKKEDETLLDLAWRLNDFDNYPNKVTLLRRETAPNIGIWQTVATLEKTDTTYTDGPLNTDNFIYEYQIVGVNNCGDSLITKLHNNVLLKVLKSEENKTTVIDFSAYKNWINDVKEYQIWRKIDNETDFQLYQTVSRTATKTEYVNADDGFKHCYRIVALEEAGNNRISYSNEVCIEFAHEIFIPNVFTPNGDNVNDTWAIRNINMYPNNTVSIYNRWGNKVAEFNAYNNTWNGNDLAEGVYFFILNLNNETPPHKGWVQIIK